MKIRIISDLHVDLPAKNGQTFGFEDKLNETDLVLVAGDISGSKLGTVKYLDNLNTKSKVIFVRGNHEGYSQPNFPPHIDTVDSIIADLRLKYAKEGNITFLEHDCIEVQDFIVVGCTLYTNFKLLNRQDISAYYARLNINDFIYVLKYINGLPTAVTPDDYIAWFKKSKSYIKSVCEKNPDKKIIVLTHFLPTPQGIAEKYRNDALNPYFTSNLEDFIKQHKNIKLWACGHTHIPFECKIGECKVVCEPYGYYGVDHWLHPKDYNGKIIEL